MKDNELFELCKRVYEKTGFDGTDECYALLQNPHMPDYFSWTVIPCHEDNIDDVDEWHPLYTSDYLLKKIPAFLSTYEYLMMECTGEKFGFGYAEYGEMRKYDFFEDTPLKALLKLTLALHDAGEIGE